MAADGPTHRRSDSLVLAPIMALTACVALGIASYTVRKELRYKDQGVSTTAQIVQKERHYSGGRHGSGWHNTLNYYYQDRAGKTFEGQGDVPLSLSEQSEKGQDLSIVYLRDEPSESRPLAGSPFWHWFGVIFLICFWGIPGLACLFIAIVEFWELAKKSVLFRRGAHVHR